MIFWIRNFFITKFIKSLLDSLPLNGKKTALGAVFIIVSVVQQLWPDNPVYPFFNDLLDILRGMDAQDVLNMSVLTFITGLGHKWLKVDTFEDAEDHR